MNDFNDLGSKKSIEGCYFDNSCFLYEEGVLPVYCLKIALNVDFELKPESKAIARRVYCYAGELASCCFRSSTL